jgi:hypothetical protein
MEDLLEIKHSGRIRLRSFSNHVDENNIIIILVLWMKESRIVEGSVLAKVDNYTWLLSMKVEKTGDYLCPCHESSVNFLS